MPSANLMLISRIVEARGRCDEGYERVELLQDIGPNSNFSASGAHCVVRSKKDVPIAGAEGNV